MQKYRNTSESRRVWTHIQLPDLSTLELDSGETVELELPDDFEDTYLKPGFTKKEQADAAKAAQKQADKEAAEAAAAAADQGVQS